MKQSISKITDATRNFFKLQAAGGIILVAVSTLAIVLANSNLAGLYDVLLHKPSFGTDYSVRYWINDALMAIFFFVVGLEIKREFTAGELSSRDRAVLPFIAAFGGILVPALIYMFFNFSSPETQAGWAIPAATDIAFTLGVMSLLGSRVPLSLKVFVTAVAIIDDLAAIIIIALFYGGDMNLTNFGLAAVGLAALTLLNKRGVYQLWPYILIGLLVWLAVLGSGVHATIAGVLVAMCIPAHLGRNLEHTLHPWVAFGILPLFGFANAGVSFDGLGINNLLDPVVLGIALGLFVGKQVGILSFVFTAVKLGISPKPPGCSWLHVYGASILCGIGFTMSLFIGSLAFTDPLLQAEVRLGVLMGSIISACFGAFVLSYAAKEQQIVKT